MSEAPADLVAPSLADIDALARAAFADLPEPVRRQCPDLVIAVEEFPDADVLAALEADDAFAITGLYEGVDLASKSVDDTAALPDRVLLYRRPLLDEWADRGNVTLMELVRHVLVHEIGHHFGLDDDAIMAIDDWTA